MFAKIKSHALFRENEPFCENLPRFIVLHTFSQKCPVSFKYSIGDDICLFW
jgi:hypothetical protein